MKACGEQGVVNRRKVVAYGNLDVVRTLQVEKRSDDDAPCVWV